MNMEKLAKKVARRGIYLDCIPFFIVGVIAVIWHATLKVSVGDDIVYFKTLMDGRNIWEILAHRYQTWSSRLAIEFVLIPIVHHTMVWRILDTIIFASIPILICKLMNANRKLSWCVAAFVLLYPFSDMVSAGWISTTTNYLWPLWCILFIGVLLKKLIFHEKIKWYAGAAGVFACIYGSSQEQVAIIMLLLFFLTGFYLWKEKCYKLPLLYLYSGINIISLTVILLCPGNQIRKIQEIEGRMPEFSEFTIWHKLYMGLANVERIFIANINNIFLIMTALLAILVYIKTKSYKKTLFSSIPILLLLGQSVIRMSHIRFKNIFVIPKQDVRWDFKSPQTYLPLLFLAVCIAGILYALYQLMKENRIMYLCTALLLGCGLASGVVMGFSPTIYASAERPYIYLYFIIIIVCLYQLKALQPIIRIEILPAGRWLLFSAVVLFALVNIADVWWICYIMGRLV